MLKSLVPLAMLAMSCITSKPPKGDTEVPQPEARETEATGEDVIVIGDQGTGGEQQYTVASAIAKYCQLQRCDFAITVGDNFYENGVSGIGDSRWNAYFEHPYRDLNFTFYPALGNHDYDGNWRAQIAYSSARWHMPARYYKVASRWADFFCIDTLHIDDAQLVWLASELAASTAAWKIVYSHMPVHSSGLHGATMGLKSKLVPVLKSGGAHMYLAGHDHHLELWGTEDGILYAISGSAGKSRRLMPWGRPIFGKGVAGFMHLDLEPRSVRLTFVSDKAEILYQNVLSK